MGNFPKTEADGNDFDWNYSEQPHVTRRIEILKKYPEIKKLMRPYGDPKRILTTAAILVCIHLTIAYLNTLPFVTRPMLYLSGATVGDLITSWLFLSIHEATHGLVFGPARPRMNRIYGLVLNMFMGWPVFSFFKKHHLHHHKYQGDYEYDIEYPTELEIKLFNRGPAWKLLWMQLNPILQLVRSAVYGPRQPIHIDDLLNYITVFGIDMIVIMYMPGKWYRAAEYLMFSVFASFGIGVIGLWSISTHTVLLHKRDTVSYYGWLNTYFLNFGFHMEHHDFPNIPSRFLPEVRRVAPEFYENYFESSSMIAACFKFLHDSNYGIHSRIKRSIPSLRKNDKIH